MVTNFCRYVATVDAHRIFGNVSVRDEADRKRHCALALFEIKSDLAFSITDSHERLLSERQTILSGATCSKSTPPDDVNSLPDTNCSSGCVRKPLRERSADIGSAGV